MKYEVIKGDVRLTVNDNIFFENQSEEFRAIYKQAQIIELKDDKGNVIGHEEVKNAEFDNCLIEVFDNGRIIITQKKEDNVITI